MRAVLKSIERHKCSSSEEMLAMKNLIEQTFLLVADVKYRDGIEKVDAAYEVFISESTSGHFEDFRPFSFELQTIATQNFAPKRIEEYLRIIYRDGGGIRTCQ